MVKRLFDLLAALLGLLLLLPLFVLIAIAVKIDSKGGVFYRQVRVGKKGRDFKIYKFRTMRVNADRLGLLTVGGKDPRVTRVGYYLRQYKLDELPQLINVFSGQMSFVGPRPEVRKYVDLYTKEQQKVLSVCPGITDLASIAFRNENELLAKQADPDKYYIDIIMPEKIRINLDYLSKKTIWSDIGVIFKTFLAILR